MKNKLTSVSIYDEVSETIEKIEEYLEFDGPNSMTEMLTVLCRLGLYMDYMTDEFQRHFADELKVNLKAYVENTKIVESEETYTIKTKEVEWY